MLRHLLAATVAVVSFATPASAQLYFRDNFSTTGNLQGRVPTPGPGGVYSATTPGVSTATSPSGALLLANNAALDGNMFGSAQIGNGFTTLASLPRWIEWRFNMRISASPVGFGTNQLGIAAVLAATATNLDSGNGYAVFYRQQGANPQFQLVNYTGGINGTINVLTNSGANPLGAGGATDFASIRVTYNPTGNAWQLFFRDDGNTGFTDPFAGGAYTFAGSAGDGTYTGSAANRVGYYFSYAGNSQEGRFDNMSISAVPEPTTWALIGLSAAGLIGGVYRYRRGANKTLNTEVDVEANEVA